MSDSFYDADYPFRPKNDPSLEVRIQLPVERIDRTWNSAAFLLDPRALCLIGDSLYICDCDHDRIVVTNVNTLDTPTVVAGTGERRVEHGPLGAALSVAISQPLSIFPGPDGSFYFTCFMMQALWHYKDGDLAILAGMPHDKGFKDGPLSQALFHNPHSGCVDAGSGKLYLADGGNHCIRVISGGMVSTIGSSVDGSHDGSFSGCSIKRPYAVTYNSQNGRIFVAEYSSVRELHPDREYVSTHCGSGSFAGFRDGPPDVARFRFIRNMEVSEDDYIVLTDEDNGKVRMIDPQGHAYTISGTFETFPSSGIAICPNGDVITSQSGANTLHAIKGAIPNPKLEPFSMEEVDKLDWSGSLDSTASPSSSSPSLLAHHFIFPKLEALAYPFIADQSSFSLEFKELCNRGHITLEDLKAFLYSSAIPSSPTASMALIHLLHKHAATRTKLVSQLARPFYRHLLGSQVSSQMLQNLASFADKELDSPDMVLPKVVYILRSRFPEVHVPISDKGERLVSEAKTPTYTHDPKSYLSDIFTLFYESRTLRVTTDQDDEDNDDDEKETGGYLRCNFTLKCAESPRASIHCHDWVLYARWPYFRNLVNSSSEEAHSRTLVFPEQTLSIDSINIIVKYLYTNTVPIDVSPSLVSEILENAALFNLSSITEPTKPNAGFELLFHRLSVPSHV